MDAIETLSHDHRIVEQLLRDYDAATTDPERRTIVETLVRELSKHAILEELIIYPLAEKLLRDGDRAVTARLGTHSEMKYVLVALDRLMADSVLPRRAIDNLMAEMREQVGCHVKEDEGDLLPRLGRCLDRDELEEVGFVLELGRHFAPTRAHLNGPERPPALALATPVAGAFDRLQDRLSGRPQG